MNATQLRAVLEELARQEHDRGEVAFAQSLRALALFLGRYNSRRVDSVVAELRAARKLP